MYQNELSKERKIYLQTQKKNKLAINAVRVFILVAFVFLWEIGARFSLIDSFVLSSPSRILSVLLDFKQNNLLLHIGTTLFETMIGFLLGVILGLIIAVLLW